MQERREVKRSHKAANGGKGTGARGGWTPREERERPRATQQARELERMHARLEDPVESVASEAASDVAAPWNQPAGSEREGDAILPLRHVEEGESGSACGCSSSGRGTSLAE